jgi:hypothetical protein
MPNFDYLMELNVFSGRSFRTLSAYPVFPWILKDCVNLELDKEENFRDLSVPVGNILTAADVLRYLARLSPFSLQPDSDQEPTFQEIDFESAECELVPEFFCQPEFLFQSDPKTMDDVVLPRWADSPFDFVYLHRKALESDFVSNCLHLWIDSVFGSLFQGPHPAKAAKQQPKPLSSVWSFNFDRTQPIVASTLVSGTSKEARFLNAYPDGSVYLHTVTIGKDSRSSLVANIDKMTRCEPCGSVLLARNDNVHVVKSSGSSKLADSVRRVKLFSNFEETLVFMLENGDIFQMNQDLQYVCSVVYETPVSIAMNANFDLLIVATLESNLLFYSLATAQFRRRSTLAREIIKQVLITEGWGFVVVLTNENLHLLNVNGFLVRSVKNTKNLGFLCSWKDARNFDYLCGTDDRGRLMICEAFYLNFNESSCYCRGSIVALGYLAGCGCVAVVRQDGKCFFVPE